MNLTKTEFQVLYQSVLDSMMRCRKDTPKKHVEVLNELERKLGDYLKELK